MEALEEGRQQRYLSLLCRYPLFYLDHELEYEPEQVQGYKYRLEWEVMTLKKTGGFTLRDSNFYDPKSNPPAEPVSTATAITTVENKNVAAQQQSDQIAMAPYKTLCIHHSNSRCLAFYQFVKGMTNLLLELIDKYRQEFPLEKLFKYSTRFEMKGMTHASAHFHGDVGKISLVLTEGKMRLDTIDMEGVLECEACRLSSVFSYSKSIQVLAHLNHLYPATKLDTYLHSVFDQINFVEPGYNMDTAISLYEKGMLEFEEKVRSETRTAGSEPRKETTSKTSL